MLPGQQRLCPLLVQHLQGEIKFEISLPTHTKLFVARTLEMPISFGIRNKICSTEQVVMG